MPPARQVSLTSCVSDMLCDLVGEKPDPDLDLTENAYAWYLGFIETTMTRVCRSKAPVSIVKENGEIL